MRQVLYGTALLLSALGVRVPQVGHREIHADLRVERLLKEADLKYRIDEDGDFAILVSLGGDRSQLAWITSKTCNLGTLEIRKIWSVAMSGTEDVPGEIALKLLKANRMVKLGAWQVAPMKGGWAVVFEAQIAAETDKTTILTALLAVINTTDEMEKDLTGADAF